MHTKGDEPRFGVVVLNWENADLTIEALASLAAANPRPDKVVIVDNDSRDGSVALIQRWASDRGLACPVLPANQPRAPVSGEWLVLLRAPSNRGFAIGNNFAIRYLARDSDVTHVFLLNNDARVRADCFEELRTALATFPRAGLVGVTILKDDSSEAIWYAGGREIAWRGLTAHITTLPTDDGPKPTQFVTGCAMLIARPVLEKVGILAECYEPFYGEDADYSSRVRRAGFPVIYAPRVVVYHRVGATVGPARLSPLVTYSQIRHRLFFIRRNFTGLTRLVAVGYTVTTKPGRALLEALAGRPRIAWALLRGVVAGLLHDPRE